MRLLIFIFVGFFVIMHGCTSKNEFSLYDNFDNALKKGEVDMSAPWKRSIAKIIIEDGKNKIPAIFSAPASSISYKLKLPNKSNIKFLSSLGIHPLAKSWGSDGFRFTISVSVGSSPPKEIFNYYSTPDSEWESMEIDLAKFKGKEVLLTLSTSNDPNKNGNADWAVWIEPRIKW